VYYQTFGHDAPRLSKQAFDPDEPTVGRVLARNIAPPRTALIIKRYLAKLEDINESLLADLYLNDGQGDGEPVQDNVRVPITLEHGPGFTREAPLAIILREQPQTTINGDSLTSPSARSAPLPTTTSPSASSLVAAVSSREVPRRSLSSLGASSSSSPFPVAAQTDSLPPMSPTEPGKVASSRKPPGWVTAHLSSKTGTVFSGSSN
jgi:hypothetical protein